MDMTYLEGQALLLLHSALASASLVSIFRRTDWGVISTFEVKEDRLDTFRDMMADVKVTLPQVNGCQSVAVYNGLDEPAVFTLVESWDSREAHQRHIESLVRSGTWEVIASHLKTDPVSRYCRSC